MPQGHHNFDHVSTASPELSRFHGFSVPLRSPWAIAAFASITLLCSAWLIIQAVRIAGSETFQSSMKLPSLSKAVVLWPANPEAHYHLGLLKYNSPDRQDLGESVRQARLATELGPLWVRYWGQLAWACESIGDSPCADHAVSRMQQLGPMDVEAISLAGNYYLVSGRPALALQQFQHLLSIDPDFGPDVFRICEAAGYPKEALEETFIQSGPQVAMAYIAYLAGAGKLDSAHQVWSSLVRKAGAGDFPLTLDLAAPYIDRLLQLGKGDELENVRLDLKRLKIIPTDSGAADNLVFNGGFEQQPSNDALDWRRPGGTYPSVDFAARKPHSGTRCLRVDFRVKANDTYLLTFQFLPLRPNSSYRLSAYVRSEDITSDSGPRLEVYDPVCRECLDAKSESTTATTPWHPVSVDFNTGPRTYLGRLEVVRPASRAVLGEITGTFWLDDVSLIRLGDAPETANNQ